MGRMLAPLVLAWIAAAPATIPLAAATQAPLAATQDPPGDAKKDASANQDATAPATPEIPLDPVEFERRLAADGLSLARARKEVRLRGDLLRRRRSPEYPVEDGLCVEGGFPHEAFGIVKCTPSLLNACFLALGLQPGLARRRVMKQPLPRREEVGTGLTEPFEVLPPQGDRVFLYVIWKEADGHEVV